MDMQARLIFFYFFCIITTNCYYADGAPPSLSKHQLQDKHGLHTVPLIRKETHLERTNGDPLGQIIEPQNSQKLDKAGPKKVTLKDIGDSSYLAQFSIGEPRQVFNLLVDTASADLWVLNKSCKDCEGVQANNSFDSSKSYTYKNSGYNYGITAGYGRTSGIVGIDTVCLGDTNTLISSNNPECTHSFPFGQATKVSIQYNSFQYDGVCGLGFNAVSSAHLTPFFDAIKANYQRQIFSLWITKAAGMGSSVGGSLTFGGTDSDHCDTGNIHYVLLSSNVQYEYQYSGVSISNAGAANNNVAFGGGTALASSGSLWMIGPTTQVPQIAKAVGAYRNPYLYGLYTIACNASETLDVTIDFRIGGRTYSVEAKNYVIPFYPYASPCLFGVVGLYQGFGVDWTLGEPFMRQYCHTFDPNNKRIGLCPSKA